MGHTVIVHLEQCRVGASKKGDILCPMNDTKLLIGSLSNDLYRVATLSHRGSHQAAERFWLEAQRWLNDLEDCEVKAYVRKILGDLQTYSSNHLAEKSETLLMYSIVLQNYTLHL